MNSSIDCLHGSSLINVVFGTVACDIDGQEVKELGSSDLLIDGKISRLTNDSGDLILPSVTHNPNQTPPLLTSELKGKGN